MELDEKSKEKGGRTLSIYLSTVLCTLAALGVTLIGVSGQWPGYTYWVIWVQMVIIIYTVLDKSIPINLQGILYCLFTCVTASMSGLYVTNPFLLFVMYIGIVNLVAFYHKSAMVMFHSILTTACGVVLQLVFHIFTLHTFTDYLELLLAFILMVGMDLSLWFNLRKDELVQEQLIAAVNKAEKAERAKGDFLANMSHEIRTPMNAIIGMCELSLREAHLPETVREYCTLIQNSGRSLLSIINDILDFSKIESGKMELVEEDFNLASTLNDVINMTISRMGESSIELIVHADPSIPRVLIGDELRLRQVMINLLTNAVKYTKEGSVVVTVTHTVREYGINLVVSVKDSGIGISKMNLEKLFNSFQQVDTKKNRSVEGTGLGLVISKSLITQMGGFITVNSEVGAGSEFKFVIPLKVKENRPFICVNDAEKITAVCYIDVNKFQHEKTRQAYREFLSHIGATLRVKCYMYQRFEDVKKRLSTGMITHCFVGREEYMEHMEFFKKVANDVSVILIQSRRNAIPVPENMRCVFKPIYELSLSSVFNKENTIVNLMEEKGSTNTFTASKAKVLVVDDNAINLQVVAGLLQPYKLKVVTASGGRKAIEILEKQDVDMVLMDHMMPELDGVETTQLIRANSAPYYQNLPIIALTANAVGGARELYLANGFNGFLTKPIELSALDRVLRQNLPSSMMEISSGRDYTKYDHEIEQTIRRVEEEIAPKESEPQMQPQESGKRENAPENSQRRETVIDTKLGLSYLANNAKIYQGILKSFAEKGPEQKQKIIDLFAAEDWKNYTIEVHALKSSSLTIGAKHMSELAKSLEFSGKDNNIDYIKQHHAEAMQCYDDVIAECGIILSQEIK